MAKSRIVTLYAALVVLFTSFAVNAVAVMQPGVNFSTALRIEPGTYTFNMGPNDSHYFSIELKRGETLYVTMRVPRNADFDIALFSPNRDLIDIGIQPSGMTERLAHVAERDGTFYILVFPFAGSEGTYELIVSIQKPLERTVVQTTTITVTETVTQKELSEVTLTLREWATKTVLERIGSTELPWTTIGLVAVAVAIIASAVLLRGFRPS